MSELPEIVELGPEDEARRLWRGAEVARVEASRDLVALCEALDLGIRAVEILVVHRLQPVRAEFPATIALQLETPSPEVDPFRDAVHVPGTLSFTAILDILSEEDSECVSPGLHRGWEDRRFACARSRRTAQEAVGVTLDARQRTDLLTLAAYRNRIFRSPPPVRVMPREILEAFGSLDRLVERLL